MSDSDEEEAAELDEDQAQAQVELHELLKHCMFARRAEALALLDLQPGLLNLRWVMEHIDRRIVQGSNALIMAGQGGDLSLVLALLERGGDLHARHYDGHDALLNAAYYAHPEVCVLLLSRGADMLLKDRSQWNALDLYGHEALDITDAEKEADRQRLREAWASGPHPSQVQRRRDENWARRWPFVQVMVLGGFQPLAARRALLQQTALPPDVALPRLPCATAAERLGLVRAKVWSHPGIWRAIAAFL